MRKTLFATTAAASLFAFGALAEQASPTAADTAPMVPGTTATEGTTPATTPPAAEMSPVLMPVTGADISAEKLNGAKILTMNGEEIAQVEDVIVTPDGAVENIVAQFGGFLGFGSNSVLLAMDEIEVMQDESGAFVVQTALTPESLDGRPEYQAEN